jgi:hypothetical protein
MKSLLSLSSELFVFMCSILKRPGVKITGLRELSTDPEDARLFLPVHRIVTQDDAQCVE